MDRRNFLRGLLLLGAAAPVAGLAAATPAEAIGWKRPTNPYTRYTRRARAVCRGRGLSRRSPGYSQCMQMQGIDA